MHKSFIILILLLGPLTLRASDFIAEEVSFLDFESELRELEASKAALEENAMKQVEAINDDNSDSVTDIVTTAQAAPEKIVEVPTSTSTNARSRRIRSR
jgi:hypothetical protein